MKLKELKIESLTELQRHRFEARFFDRRLGIRMLTIDLASNDTEEIRVEKLLNEVDRLEP